MATYLTEQTRQTGHLSDKSVKQLTDFEVGLSLELRFFFHRLGSYLAFSPFSLTS